MSIKNFNELVFDMEWISVKKKLPEYSAQIRGNCFVNIILADNAGGVWPGDYTNGKFMVFGVEHPHITHWMPYPEPPDNKSFNRNAKASG